MSVLKKINSKSKKEIAQSLIEFALTFSVIMLVLSGIVDFGRIFFTLIALNDAAQEGAMFGAMQPDLEAEIISRVRTSSDGPIDLTDPVAVDVIVEETTLGKLCAGLDVNDKPYGLEISVEYDFNFTMPFLTSIVPDNILTLKGYALHTILFPPCT